MHNWVLLSDFVFLSRLLSFVLLLYSASGLTSNVHWVLEGGNICCLLLGSIYYFIKIALNVLYYITLYYTVY